MARLTPNDILGLSEPIELVYSNIVDSLLVNMARHFNSGYSLSTQEWEIRKLAELGQLNRESMEIIANLTGQNPALMQTVLENAAYAATKDIEPELKKGVKAGAIDPPAADNVIASKSVSQALKAYDAQALDKLNLVNTTMLRSTLDQYRKVIANTVNIERQMQASQAILNAAAGKVIAGTESRTAALRQALSQIHAEGITGFIDRAGRRWSPEAYVNMDVRTTVHNTAIEAVKLRQQDYGVEIFRVSRHSGARPLCYPYQGRYFSWNNKSGTFTDGEGKRHRYAPISSTSYGKPAGLFGINCGHHPITVIPGVSIPRDMPEQSKEENDRIYAESQQQRKLERDIRYAKQKAAMLDAAGDKEGFANEAAKVKQRQAAYNAFCKETGRTKRLDRTQVFDYNKSVSSKATAAVKRAEKAKKLEAEKYQQIRHHSDGTIVVTDDWKTKGKVSIPRKYKPNAVIETQSTKKDGTVQVDRTIYGDSGLIKTQIHSGPHGRPDKHPYGNHGEHTHRYTWDTNGTLSSRKIEELTEQEKAEHADILGGDENER